MPQPANVWHRVAVPEAPTRPVPRVSVMPHPERNMANLGKKDDIYVARFRYAGKEYKKSLRTTRKADAEAAMHAVERAIHGLTTGMLQVPPGVDPGDFILSGGTLRQASRRRQRVITLAVLID